MAGGGSLEELDLLRGIGEWSTVVRNRSYIFVLFDKKKLKRGE
jgi:hypothetical protein